jgi:alpha-L-fucosidase
MSQLTRRNVLAAAASAFMLGPRSLRSSAADDADDLPLPLPRQRVWQDCEVGAIFHFDMPLFADGGRTHHNSIHQTWDPQIYNPRNLDTDQWIEAAKAMGARYAIFTATHFNGFMQWQSDLYPYGVKQASWRGGKGDVVQDFVDSCRKVDIKPGIYMSCFRNAWWKVDRYRVEYGKGGKEQAKFARICEKMFEELCTRYGPLVQIWFDAGNISPAEGGPNLLPIADRHQPDMVFYHSPERREHRWIGNEAGYAGYPCWATMPDLETAERMHKGRGKDWRKLLAHGDPDGKLWSPGMVDTVLRNHHWFWYPQTERTIEPLDRLVNFYYQSVGRNCNLVLGLTPNPSGLLPEPDFRRCEEFGAEIRRRFARPVAETRGIGRQLTLDLPSPCTIDHAVMMEDITGGERVRTYRVDGRVSGETWQTLCEGMSIGHKRIQRFNPIRIAAVRLVVTDSVAQPRIRNLAAYHVG